MSLRLPFLCSSLTDIWQTFWQSLCMAYLLGTQSFPHRLSSMLIHQLFVIDHTLHSDNHFFPHRIRPAWPWWRDYKSGSGIHENSQPLHTSKKTKCWQIDEKKGNILTIQQSLSSFIKTYFELINSFPTMASAADLHEFQLESNGRHLLADTSHFPKYYRHNEVICKIESSIICQCFVL